MCYQDAALVMSVMATCFPATTTPEGYCNNPGYYRSCHGSFSTIVPVALANQVKAYRTPRAGDVNYMFYTKPGPGPITLTDESLLDLNGQPIPPGPKHRRLVISSASAVNVAVNAADAATFTLMNVLSQPGRYLGLAILPLVGYLAFRSVVHCQCKKN